MERTSQPLLWMEPGLQALLKTHSALLEYDAALDKVRCIQSGHTMPAVARAVEQFVRCAWQRTSKCSGRCLARNATHPCLAGLHVLRRLAHQWEEVRGAAPEAG